MQKQRILVVDDERAIAEFVKKALEKTGAYEVCAETESTRALKTALNFKPDFIFMDVWMPGVDGAELVARFKEKEILREIPIVFLTGAATKSEVEMEDGLIGGRLFLAKPVSVRELIATVEFHLKNQSSAAPLV